MYTAKYAPATVTSFISAISFVHKLLGLQDPGESHTIKKMLQGFRRMAGQPDGRLPITEGILLSILNAAKSVFPCAITCARFSDMCSLAFYALLRPGEITESHNNLQFSDAHLDRDKIIIQFRSFKHSQGALSTHTITAKPGSPACPLRSMSNFMIFRGNKPGPLFTTTNNKAVGRRDFAKELRSVIQFLGMDIKRYTPHSFRIGGASSLAAAGASDAQIRQAGRWASSAFLNYIR